MGDTTHVLSAIALAATLFSISYTLRRPQTINQLGSAKNYAAIIAIIIAALFLLSGLLILWLHYGTIGRTDVSDKEKFILLVVFAANLFFGMLTGMVAKYFHELSKAGKTFKDAKISDLLVPLTVSVVIFFTVWGAVSGQPVGFLSVGIAVQNGFFWQDVLGKVHA